MFARVFKSKQGKRAPRHGIVRLYVCHDLVGVRDRRANGIGGAL
jgi:hypothetical protein